MTTQNLKYIGIAGCALAIIGAFLVWAKLTDGVTDITIKGTDSGKDGTYSLILALQIKAREVGLPTPVYGLPEVHHLR